MDGATSLPTTKRPNVQMPDEYLPPNKILFLQNLPETVTKEQLNALFSQLCPLPPSTSFFSDSLQIPQPTRSPSHSHKKRYCICGIHGRRECNCGKGGASQLQVGWREQNQSLSSVLLSLVLMLMNFLDTRSHSQESRQKIVSYLNLYLVLTIKSVVAPSTCDSAQYNAAL